jgi:hypothetical protein
MLKDFEKKAIALLTFGLFTYADVIAIDREAEFVGIEHTGGGYFLTLRHPGFPQERRVFDMPILSGEAPGVRVGFIVFIENGQMTLECHDWGADGVPENIRDMDVQVDPGRIENGKFIKF